MASFQYKARGARGDLLEGVLEAPSADAVATQLLNSGVTPVEIAEHEPGSFSLEKAIRALTAQRPDLAELILFCRERLAHYKCPRSVDFDDDLPRSDAGKIYRRRVRDRYWQGRETSI